MERWGGWVIRPAETVSFGSGHPGLALQRDVGEIDLTDEGVSCISEGTQWEAIQHRDIDDFARQAGVGYRRNGDERYGRGPDAEYRGTGALRDPTGRVFRVSKHCSEAQLVNR